MDRGKETLAVDGGRYGSWETEQGQWTGEGEQGTTGRGESFATGAENLLGRFKTNY